MAEPDDDKQNAMPTGLKHFLKMAVGEHKTKYPSDKTPVKELSAIYSKKWELLPEEQKKKFVVLAQFERKKRRQEKEKDMNDNKMLAKPQGKKRKVEKDPNAPAKPQNAYFYFMKAKRPDIVAALGTTASPADISKEIGRQWRELQPEKKHLYEEMFLRAKAEYEAKLKIYEANLSKHGALSSNNANAKDSSSASTSADGFSNYCTENESEEFQNNEDDCDDNNAIESPSGSGCQ